MPADSSHIDAEAARWNHVPEAMVLNPVFAWPPQPLAVIRWYSGAWLSVTTTTLSLILAFWAYFWVLPPLAEMSALAPGWIARVWLANLIPHVICAAALHHWLCTRKGQGMAYKFDKRQQTKGKVFTFNNQVLDNMFWTIASGITIWTAWQVLVFWAMANGWAPGILFPGNPVWFVLFFAILPIWTSFHFYWVHRLLHWPPLYRLAHSLHHRNVSVGPWSGISMHPVEHLVFFSNFLIHLIVPSHPLHVMFHGYIQATHPVFSHSGFEKLYVKDKTRMNMGVFYHQLHHRYFECNYGTVDIPWDRWFGSSHDGSARATDATRARQKRMFG